ncbi:MAG: alpha-L-fucosidase, partial [Bacteroidota bacterium]|nr:alpha-L-fucosidase [Bacteroidota bacterium]
IFCFLFSLTGRSQTPVGPFPGARQLAWQNAPFYLFMHFGPNTFTDLEWGKGSEKEEVFNPTALDCRQWCRIAKEAGATGIIITAKHHDGFCLWPSAYSKHTVAQSKWKQGKGDVLKELSEACRDAGLSFGVYLSPWDRNHPAYGTAAYNDVFVNMMKEVVSHYGPFFEFWWDGANGEGPNGKKQVYDWHRFESTIRQIAPNTMVFSDIGPDIRWAGNENGIAGSTNWNLLDTAGFTRGLGAPPNDTLNQGNVNGKNWIPAECDVSIRPGWFYHPGEDSLVKTPQKLFDIYLKSIGRGANLILNIPPDRRGLISPFDSAALVDFAILRQASFFNNLIINENAVIFWAGKNITDILGDGNGDFDLGGHYDKEYLEILFSKPTAVNCIFLKENLVYGQRVKSFALELYNGDSLVYKNDYTTIGYRRLISFPSQTISRILIKIKQAKAEPILNGLGIYHIPDQLVEK